MNTVARKFKKKVIEKKITYINFNKIFFLNLRAIILYFHLTSAEVLVPCYFITVSARSSSPDAHSMSQPLENRKTSQKPSEVLGE